MNNEPVMRINQFFFKGTIVSANYGIIDNDDKLKATCGKRIVFDQVTLVKK